MAELSEREQTILVKALEGTLSASERKEFDILLQANSDFAFEWRTMKPITEATMALKFRVPNEETWDRYWAGVYSRMERGFAWLLMSIGGAIIIALALFQGSMAIAQDTAMPLIFKIALGVLFLGVGVLLVSVIREKWVIGKTDKYKEVIR
ncbi:MAG: hypothetical protein V1799_10335 [bacterium]